jgi:hypothetical protein
MQGKIKYMTTLKMALKNVAKWKYVGESNENRIFLFNLLNKNGIQLYNFLHSLHFVQYRFCSVYKM